MTTKLMRMAVGACVALAAGAGRLGAQEPFEWSGRIGSGGTLEVKGITGSIRAELTSGSAAEVVVEKRGRPGDFDEVEVRMVQEGDDVVICAVYGARGQGDDCDSNDGGERRRWGRNRSIDVAVDFVVRLPAGTALHAAMVTGDIDVVGVRSDVTANTVTGDITVSTTGIAHASTVSGSLDVAMDSGEWKDLDFSTVSGDITLRFPAGLDADVDFTSLSGDLESDFDLTRRERARRQWVGARVRGTIGDGGRSLSVKTVSGDLRLVRSR